MRTCPKCRRTYEDSVDFCLRDGKPLVEAEASESVTSSAEDGRAEAEGAEKTPEGGNMPRPVLKGGGRARSSPLLKTGVLQTVRPPKPGAAQREPAKDGEEGEDGRSIEPVAGTRGDGHLTIRPWVPGQPGAGKASGGPPPSEGDESHVPPWESAEPIPPSRIALIRPPEPAEAEEAPSVTAEAPVRTPDIPSPPPERDEAVPVGDETVLELTEEDLGDSLELVVPEPDPITEVPLVSRLTPGSAISRYVMSEDAPRPPVDEEGDSEQRLAILTEEDSEPPVPGEDDTFDRPYLVVGAGRSKGDDAGERATPRRGGLLWGMAAVVVAALLYVGYVSLSTSADSAGADRGQVSSVKPFRAAPASNREFTHKEHIPNGFKGNNSAIKAPAKGLPDSFVKEGGKLEPPPEEHSSETSSVGSAESAEGAMPGNGEAQSLVDGGGADGVPAGTGEEAPKVGASSVSSPGGEGEETGPLPGKVESAVGAERVPNAPKVNEEPAPAKTESVRNRRTPPKRGPVKKETGTAKTDSSPGKSEEDSSKRGVEAPSVSRAPTRKPGVRNPGPRESKQVEESQPKPPPTMTLLVTSNKIGADIYVDGIVVGQIPMTLALGVGEHLIEVAPKDAERMAETVVVNNSTAVRSSKYFKF